MNEIKSPIKWREIIIASTVALAMLILGGFFDFQLSVNVYDSVDTNLYGIIFAGIAELPVCIGLTFAGGALIVSIEQNDSKVKKILSWIFGIASIGVAGYFLFNTWMDMTEFNKTTQFNPSSDAFSNPAMIILGVIFTLAVLAAVILFIFFKRKSLDKHVAFQLAVWFIILAAGVAILSNIGKFLWSRPRPRYINGSIDDFKAIWQLNPFGCFDGTKWKGNDNFKSFPSGHTTYAATGMFIFPLITLMFPNTKNDRKVQIILFYVGLLWAVIVAFGRVFAGAHFLSDTAGGMISSLIIGSVINILLNKVKFGKKKEEKPQEDEAKEKEA